MAAIDQETTQAGLPDIPIWLDSARAEAAQADFSIDDYGRLGTERPYQIVYPAYKAPKFLQRFADLGQALRMCSTLCQLKGKPFRVVRWERSGSGALPGGVPCRVCRKYRPVARFPDQVRQGSGCLEGFPDARPIAEFHPDGQRMVFDNCGNAKIVGRPNYIVSANPFPREYDPRPLPQRYLEAVKTGQILANRRGKRVFLCSDFGMPCKHDKQLVPVVYVDPGGLVPRYDTTPEGTTGVTPVSPAYFKELVAESRGASFLGPGA